MHPKEAYKQKTGTGRLAHISLPNSTIVVGQCFSHHSLLGSMLSDPAYVPMVLFPGPDAIEISNAAFFENDKADRDPKAPKSRVHILTNSLFDRVPLIIILDATWSLAKKMFLRSPDLVGLPRISFLPKQPSGYKIKRQPDLHFVSTIEAVFNILACFDEFGIERLQKKHQSLLDTFAVMVQYQIDAKDSSMELGRFHENKKKRRLKLQGSVIRSPTI